MPEISAQPESMPIPATSQDRDGLLTLADIHDDMLQNDVLFIREDAVPEIVRIAKESAGKIEKALGSAASSELVTMGLVVLTKPERMLLEIARRSIGPNILSDRA